MTKGMVIAIAISNGGGKCKVNNHNEIKYPDSVVVSPKFVAECRGWWW